MKFFSPYNAQPPEQLALVVDDHVVDGDRPMVESGVLGYLLLGRGGQVPGAQGLVPVVQGAVAMSGEDQPVLVRLGSQAGRQHLPRAGRGVHQDHVVVVLMDAVGFLHRSESDQRQHLQREARHGRQAGKFARDARSFFGGRLSAIDPSPRTVAGLIPMFLHAVHQYRLNLEFLSRNRERRIRIPLARGAPGRVQSRRSYEGAGSKPSRGQIGKLPPVQTALATHTAFS